MSPSSLTSPPRPALAVDPEIWLRFPSFRALVVWVDGLVNPQEDGAIRAFQRQVERETRERFAGARPTSDPHLAAWREVYSAFGSKPSKYPTSAEALIKRVLGGSELPAISAAVDLYNALSVRHRLPVGGEDQQRVVGSLVLAPATGEETFAPRGLDTTAGTEAEDELEHPDPGEVVWKDGMGVTCRRWNWRQGRRTALTPETTHAYFLFESLAPYPEEELHGAADTLEEHLRRLAPECRVERQPVTIPRA